MHEQKNLTKFLQGLTPLDPPQYLYGNILIEVNRVRRRQARIRVLGLGMTALFSLVISVPVFRYTLAEFNTSGFNQYVSLMFSDGTALLGLWKEFSLSLAESFPLTGTLTLLVTALVFLGSLKSVVKNLHTAFLSAQHI